MFDVLQTAVNGLRVAETCAAAAASKIANLRVSVQEANPNAVTAPDSPAAVAPAAPAQSQVFSGGPDSQGLANGRGLDLAANIVELALAQRAYEANAAVIRSSEETLKHLLDSVA